MKNSCIENNVAVPFKSPILIITALLELCAYLELETFFVYHYALQKHLYLNSLLLPKCIFVSMCNR